MVNKMALSSQRFDRKVFLSWALGSTSAVVLGCSDAGTEPPPTGTAGTGGSGVAGTGGTSAFPTGGTFGTAGTTTSAGTGGTAGGAGGSGGAAGGTGGAAGGSGGAAPMPNCGTQLKTTITANHGHVLNVTLDDVM